MHQSSSHVSIDSLLAASLGPTTSADPPLSSPPPSTSPPPPFPGFTQVAPSPFESTTAAHLYTKGTSSISSSSGGAAAAAADGNNHHPSSFPFGGGGASPQHPAPPLPPVDDEEAASSENDSSTRGANGYTDQGLPPSGNPLRLKTALSRQSSVEPASAPFTGRISASKRSVSWADLTNAGTLTTVKEYQPECPPASPLSDSSWEAGDHHQPGCACTLM